MPPARVPAKFTPLESLTSTREISPLESVGAVVKTTRLASVPNAAFVPVAWKTRVEPPLGALPAKLAKVRVEFWPVVLMRIVFAPKVLVNTPSVSLEAVLPLTKYSKTPVARVRARAAPPKRLAVFVPVLSRRSVAPELAVAVEALPSWPLPEMTNVPALTVSAGTKPVPATPSVTTPLPSLVRLLTAPSVPVTERLPEPVDFRVNACAPVMLPANVKAAPSSTAMLAAPVSVTVPLIVPVPR